MLINSEVCRAEPTSKILLIKLQNSFYPFFCLKEVTTQISMNMSLNTKNVNNKYKFL